MDKLYEQTMLFDFYGELLTEHQRRVYEDAVYNDLSLSEIAEEQGISRQGVHDLIKRCDRILQEYESKLHLVERFAKAKETVKEIQSLAGGEVSLKAADEEVRQVTEQKNQDKKRMQQPGEQSEESRLQRIAVLSGELLKEL